MTMKILFTAADANDLIAQVHADLIATDAQYRCRPLDGQVSMFTPIVWPDIDLGISTFWSFVVLADNRRGSLLLLARSTDRIPDSKRDAVEEQLATAYVFTDAGQFEWMDGDNLIQFTHEPISFNQMPDGLKGVFAVIDDALAMLTPSLKKAIYGGGGQAIKVKAGGSECRSYVS